MREFFLIATAAASMFAVGCVSPASVCETGANVTCDKLFECGSAELKASFGTSAEDCKTKLIADGKCSEMKDYDEFCTSENAGKTFDLDNGSACLDEYKSLSCADYNAGKIPAVCDQVCK